jgi:hypothetical protein
MIIKRKTSKSIIIPLSKIKLLSIKTIMKTLPLKKWMKPKFKIKLFQSLLIFSKLNSRSLFKKMKLSILLIIHLYFIIQSLKQNWNQKNKLKSFIAYFLVTVCTFWEQQCKRKKDGKSCQKNWHLVVNVISFGDQQISITRNIVRLIKFYIRDYWHKKKLWIQRTSHCPPKHTLILIHLKSW